MAPALEFEDWLQMAAAVLALAIALAAALAWRRRPTGRTAMVALAFLLFAVRGALVVTADLVGQGTGDVLESLAVPLEVAFLAAIALVLLRA